MTKIAFGGDVHGNTQQIIRYLQVAQNNGATTLYLVGDWNLYMSNGFIRDVEKYASLFGVTIYWLDGNHDDFPFIQGINPDNLKTPIEITPHVFYMPRNHQFTLYGLRFHVIGGAHSIDERFRELNYSLFAEEDITEEDIEYALTLPQADILLSHDCPDTVQNPITSDVQGQLAARRAFGHEALDKCAANQARLSRITNHINPALIIHGHYHHPYEKYSVNPTTGDRFLTIGLDEGGTHSVNDALRIFDTDELHDLVKDIRR